MESLSLCCYVGREREAAGELCREYAESILTLDWRDKATAKFDEESQV